MNQIKKKSLAKDIPVLGITLMAFGLYPKSSKPRIQVIYRVYQFLIALLVIGVCVWCFLNYTSDIHDGLSTVVKGMVYAAQTIAHVIIITEAFFIRKKHQEFFDVLAECDEFFQTKFLFDAVNTKRIKRTMSITTIAIVFVVVVSKLGILAVNAGQSQFYFWNSFNTFITIALRCAQINIYATLVEGQLNTLNCKLEEVIKNKCEFQPATAAASSIFPEDYRLVERQIGASQIQRITCGERILGLKQVYNRLWDAMNLLNDCFGWSLLIISIFYFLSFTSDVYHTFASLEVNYNGKTVVYALCDIIPKPFVIGILARTCQNCTSNGEKTGTILHKIKKLDNEEHDAVISEFSLQVIQEPFEMSAKGFFTINIEFLGSMAAASMTYLVILIQFLFSSNPK